MTDEEVDLNNVEIWNKKAEKNISQRLNIGNKPIGFIGERPPSLSNIIPLLFLDGVEDSISCFKEGVDRAKAKKIMFCVFFSKNKATTKNGWRMIPYEADKKLFAQVFPLIAENIHDLKNFKKHNTLAIFFQRLESYLFIDCLVSELIKEGIVPFTIHDSIIVPRHQAAQALAITKAVFLEQLGSVPSFKLEAMGTLSKGAPDHI